MTGCGRSEFVSLTTATIGPFAVHLYEVSTGRQRIMPIMVIQNFKTFFYSTSFIFIKVQSKWCVLYVSTSNLRIETADAHIHVHMIANKV